MRRLPHTDDDVQAMLETTGGGSISDLFRTVPESCRRVRFGGGAPDSRSNRGPTACSGFPCGPSVLPADLKACCHKT